MATQKRVRIRTLLYLLLLVISLIFVVCNTSLTVLSKATTTRWTTTQQQQQHQSSVNDNEENNNVVIVSSSIDDDQKSTIKMIINQRIRAEQIWKNGQGYMWFQHSRKAGGTSLCMTLLKNSNLWSNNNLVRFGNDVITTTRTTSNSNQEDDSLPKRRTCQLKEFCWNCNVKRIYQSPNDLVLQFKHLLQKHDRNFLEMEGSGVPIDMTTTTTTTTNNMWNDTVFITTIRHPLLRIMSSLKRDGYFRCFIRCHAELTRNDNDDRHQDCLEQNILHSDDNILDLCQQPIFDIMNIPPTWCCLSNYLVRTLSGLEDGMETKPSMEQQITLLKNNNNNMTSVNKKLYNNNVFLSTSSSISPDEMLERAKQNFHRFSCIIIQEYWNETISCLGRRLGLTQRQELAYNVDNQLFAGIQMNQDNNNNDNDETLSLLLQKNQYWQRFGKDVQERLIRLNKQDLDFYEWAKKQILS